MNENENHRGILVKVYYMKWIKNFASFIDESQNLVVYFFGREWKLGFLQQLKAKAPNIWVRILHKIDRRFDSQQIQSPLVFGKKAQDPEMDQGFANLLSLAMWKMLPLRAELELEALRESEGTALCSKKLSTVLWTSKGQAFMSVEFYHTVT